MVKRSVIIIALVLLLAFLVASLPVQGQTPPSLDYTIQLPLVVCQDCPTYTPTPYIRPTLPSLSTVTPTIRPTLAIR